MNELASLADGLFYPADRSELDELITGFLTKSENSRPEDKSDQGTLRGVITPHGAYQYCGAYMASAYTALAREAAGKKPERIILISPLHRESEEGFFMTACTGITLPAGPFRFDQTAAESLSKRPFFSFNELPFAEEPSLEIQFPFLFKLFPDIPVLPLFGRSLRAGTLKALGAGLEQLPESLIVLTSNLGDYRPREESRALADEFINALEEPGFSPSAWLSERKGGLPKPCGIELLQGLWSFFNKQDNKGALMVKTLSWGPDIKEAEAEPGNDKAAFYGGFGLYSQNQH